MQLEGKRFVVTGGSGGIGEQVVRAFVSDGAIVASLDIQDELGRSIAETATEKGPGTARYFHCDVASRAEVESVFHEATKHLGGLDGLAHTAGIIRRSAAEEINDELWDSHMNVNLRGTMLTNQAALKGLREAGGGVIINFGSNSGLAPSMNNAAYAVTKAGIHAWTRAVAMEWGPLNIRVNAVLPVVATPMSEADNLALSPHDREVLEAGLRSRIWLGGKLGDPARDLAPVLVFLAGDGARFITGQLIAVDGGYIQVR